MRQIKVVHINTYLKGGAFQAALRLHKGLLKIDVDSHFVGLNGKNLSGKMRTIDAWHNVLYRVATKYKLPINQTGRNARKIPRSIGSYEFYSFPTSDYDLTKHPLVRDADIIHLHWVNNFLDYPSFFKKINKPVVWTLHDMNLFQGGFHYLNDHQLNAHAFKSVDDELLKIKRNSLSHVSNLQLVCPSNWLKNVSENEELTARFLHHHLFNCVDLNLFKPADDMINVRRKYQLPEDKFLVLFVAGNISNHRKGFDLLLPVVQSLKHRTDISFAAIGEIDRSLKQSNIIELGFIQNEKKLAEIYAAADAVIIPSREDNFPNVMLEAFACGTPVIGFPVGGIPEVVKTGFTGILVEEVSSKALKSALLRLAEKEIDLNRDLIRAFAEQNFDPIKVAGKHKEIYVQMLEKNA